MSMENTIQSSAETRHYKLTGKSKYDNTERAFEWNGSALNTATLAILTKKKFSLTGTPEQINNSWRVLTKSACLTYERID